MGFKDYYSMVHRGVAIKRCYDVMTIIDGTCMVHHGVAVKKCYDIMTIIDDTCMVSLNKFDNERVHITSSKDII